MSTFDLSSMNPPDASAALRSFPRRFREAAAAAILELGEQPDQEAVEELLRRPGPAGPSAIDHITSAARILQATHAAVRAALISDSATVDASALLAVPGQARSPQGTRSEDELAGLVAAAEAFASTVEAADARRWLSPVKTTAGAETTALALLRDAVGAALVELRSLERVLRFVRGRS